jgi:hypothetical protein
MKKINKNIGAKVLVREVTVDINPKVKWKCLKNVPGTIVENLNYEFYYHTCSGAYTYIVKHKIENPAFPVFAIKLDNDIVDIEGNNIIVQYEHDIKFLEKIEIPKKAITEKQYLKAKEIVRQYELGL